MDVLDLASFQNQAHRYDQLVWRTPGIDRFCSSSAWIIAAQEAFHKGAEVFILRGDHGYVPLIAMDLPEWGRLMLPLEASWFLSCPLISPKPAALTDELVTFLATSDFAWDACLFSGFMEGSPIYKETLRAFMPGYHLYHGPSVTRCIAELGGGLEGFLSRRSRAFRKNMRRIERLTATQFLDFEWVNQPLAEGEGRALFQRLIEVEGRSWKGCSGVGVDQGGMRDFYFRLMQLQGPKGWIRLGFARQNGCDMGYILGAVMGGVYRGYQFSFDQRMEHLSLGNWMQLRAIEHLCGEQIHYYDLGTDMAYKQKWSEFPFETVSFIVSKQMARSDPRH